jgi:hypothetical protein
MRIAFLIPVADNCVTDMRGAGPAALGVALGILIAPRHFWDRQPWCRDTPTLRFWLLKTAGAGRDARRPFAGLSLLGALKGVLDPIQTKLTFSLLPLRLSLIDLGNLGRAFS